jgi:hypothetical protein
LLYFYNIPKIVLDYFCGSCRIRSID